MSSSSKSDPRKEEAIVPFHLPRKSELEEDWSSVLATFVAMAGIMTRNRFKMIPWVAAYFGLTAALNTRKSLKNKDSLANNGALLSFVSLFTFYLNLYLVHKKGMEAVANGDVKII
ncbi:uncharacterized protein B0P05DRAFT_531444 [Gilbertella persicaria]|uniref:uncharacterized protein n=1 Tax=Gilbertella persicaria TaxID=101096 RepID=UPI00222117CD|nr:uncharacterized protein B0P05DRAFT_531444 [Gilbertella persicaria]KAI8088101.1 hypothetical protein B0P05DRAFT_531444 [Gilbertella persicaria]